MTFRLVLTVSVLTLHGGLPGPGSAQPSAASSGYVVSERVGPDIDAQERSYFNLFPSFDGFVVARPESPSDSTFRIAIERAGRPDTALNVDPEVAVVLGRYLDEFEYVYRNAAAVDWKYLIQVARVKKPFGSGMPLAVKRTDGTLVKGQLLHIDDSGLLVTAATKVPAMLRSSEEAVWIPAGSVREIRDQRSRASRMFGTVWLLEAGSDVMYQSHVVPLLVGKAMLKDVLSPELHAVKSHGAVVPPYGLDRSVDQIYHSVMSSRLHITAIFQPVPSAVHVRESGRPRIVSADGTLWTDYLRHPMRFARIAYGIRVDYDISALLSVGVEYGRQLGSDQRPATLWVWSTETPSMVGSHVTSWLKVSLKRAQFKTQAYSPAPRLAMLALSCDVGISVAWFESQFPDWFQRDQDFAENQARVGGSVAFNAEHYLSHRLSIVGGLQFSVYPNLQFPLVEFTYSPADPSDLRWRLDAYNQALWVMDLRAGLRVHLGS